MNWYDIRNSNDPELDRLAAELNLHPLHVEDCRHRDQRAKVEEAEGYLFVVLKPVELTKEGTLAVADLDIFLGPDFLITVDEQGLSGSCELLDRVRSKNGAQRPDQV